MSAPICPSCGQPASSELAGPPHQWECRNEACPEFGHPIKADEAPAVEPPVVRAFPTPAAPPRALVATTATVPSEPWGRGEDDGTVSVRVADGWRVVGQ
jgi:hypothetical protein